MSILKHNARKRKLSDKNLDEGKDSSSEEEDLKIPVRAKIKRGKKLEKTKQTRFFPVKLKS